MQEIIKFCLARVASFAPVPAPHRQRRREFAKAPVFLALLGSAWAGIVSSLAGDAPVILQQPQSIMVPVGETLQLTCTVSGTPPIALIWQRDGAFLGNHTNSTLIITNAQTAHSGRYRLTASNDDGMARSTNADVLVYTNHQCDFPPSWVSYYRGLSLAEAAPVSVTQLGSANALVPDNAGNLFVLGDAYSLADNGVAMKTIKYDSAGRQVWVASYHQDLQPPYTFNNGGTAITLDSQGNVAVAGVAWCFDQQAQGQWRQVYAIVKYAPDGTKLWAAHFTNSCGYTGSTSSYSVNTDEAGAVYVAGSVGVVKYSSHGEQLWSSCGSYNHSSVRVLRNGLGHYLAAETLELNADLVLGRYDTNGAAIWSTRLNFGTSPMNESLGGRGIAVDASNNLCVAVTSHAPGAYWDSDVVAVKFALDGTHLWTRTYGAPYRTDSATDFAVDGSGNLIVVGDSWTSPNSQTPSDGSGYDVLVLKYSPDGTLLWTANYGDAPSSEDHAQAVAVDFAGNIYISGFTRPGDPAAAYKGLVLKYSPDGVLLWRMRMRPGEAAYPIATDAAGDVFAAGHKNFVARSAGGEASYNELLAMKLGQNEPRLAVCTGLQPDGWFHGLLVSLRGSAFDILANTNLLGADWQRVWTATNYNGVVPFYDPQAGQHPMRFYRAGQTVP